MRKLDSGEIEGRDPLEDFGTYAAANLRRLDGFEAAAAAWERFVLPARMDRYDASELDLLCLTGRVGWARLFAGSCLIANGLYLGVGSFGAIGDAGDIIRHGSPTWTLWLFGAATVPAGLGLWNGLGPKFGLGPSAEEVSSRLAYGCLASLLAVIGIMLIWSS
jgi:hypothetical protein